MLSPLISMLPNMISTWRFEDAPVELSSIFPEGVKTDGLALIPPHIVSSEPGWVESGGPFQDAEIARVTLQTDHIVILGRVE